MPKGFAGVAGAMQVAVAVDFPKPKTNKNNPAARSRVLFSSFVHGTNVVKHVVFCSGGNGRANETLIPRCGVEIW